MVFVGEASQYHLPLEDTAPFTGDENDTHMPKRDRHIQRSLRLAIHTTRLIQAHDLLW